MKNCTEAKPRGRTATERLTFKYRTWTFLAQVVLQEEIQDKIQTETFLLVEMMNIFGCLDLGRVFKE